MEMVNQISESELKRQEEVSKKFDEWIEKCTQSFRKLEEFVYNVYK